MYAFGTGDIILTPYGANVPANPTPIKVGVLQEVTIDISATLKELHGKKQFAARVARGSAKISGKCKSGNFFGKLISDTFFGNALAVGGNIPVIDESSPIAATVTVLGSATFVDDLGVVNGSAGTPMVKVASAPAAGQYSVTAGSYTFAAADVTSAFKVLISYSKSSTTVGGSFLLTNPAIGNQPVFTCQFSELDAQTGKTLLLKLYACIFAKFAIGSKVEDFVIPDLEFAAFADASDNVMQFSIAD